ncbi:MAG TPA: NAD-dependent malic enzyme [Clostridia bacterium]|nr:NAD-dependent malic enzyme [Clostridia bacterium]
MNRELALKIHAEHRGKIEIQSKVELDTPDSLGLAYTPGVAEPCKEIQASPAKVYEYTAKGNLVAVVTDGSAVLGLGNIGPEAALPVMEGKAILFKKFANVDAFPICLATQDVDEIVNTVKYLAPTFGGINLEDISAPRCFEIERRLKQVLDIPVFHDDQHGTAIVVLAALINSCKLIGKQFTQITAVINGAGSAGIAIAKLLLKFGLEDVIVCDRNGIITPDSENLNWAKEEIAQITNKKGKKGDLKLALEGADVFIGVSSANVLTSEMIAGMNPDSIVFALANPIPEIMPDLALKAGAKIVGTGRSDFPNQINNVLAFPGVFRGALDVQAREINDEMKIAAAYAISSLVDKSELKPEYIIPSPFDSRVARAVANAVSEQAIRTGVARRGEIILK